MNQPVEVKERKSLQRYAETGSKKHTPARPKEYPAGTSIMELCLPKSSRGGKGALATVWRGEEAEGAWNKQRTFNGERGGRRQTQIATPSSRDR